MPGFFKRGGHSARSLLRHCAQVGITRAVDIVQSRPVETHDRQAKLRAVKQRQKRRRRPVRHNGDIRAALGKLGQTDACERGHPPAFSKQPAVERARKQDLPAARQRQVRAVDRKRYADADQGVKNAVECKQIRIDVHAVRNRNAHKDHAGDVRGARFPKQHRDIDQYNHHERHKQVLHNRPIPRQKRAFKQQQRHARAPAGQRTHDAVERNLDAV